MPGGATTMMRLVAYLWQEALDRHTSERPVAGPRIDGELLVCGTGQMARLQARVGYPNGPRARSNLVAILDEPRAQLVLGKAGGLPGVVVRRTQRRGRAAETGQAPVLAHPWDEDGR